jgi:hypothetical protein
MVKSLHKYVDKVALGYVSWISQLFLLAIFMNVTHFIYHLLQGMTGQTA